MITGERLADASTISICPSCAGRNPAHARFCSACGARMSTETGERRLVSVLFADLSGFTTFSESADPEAVRALAETAASRFGEIVVRHGGTVDKIIGDCVMATFGAPVARDDDPERAVRAALAIQEEVATRGADYAGLRVSIGVMTGGAIYAPVGPAGDYTVLGDTVNIAARLQSAAGRGEVFIGDATAAAVQGRIDLDPVDQGDDAEAPRAWRALGPAGVRRRPRPRAPLVGRRFELDHLRELWERALTDERAYLVAIRGPAGIGTSRLVRTFAEQLPEHPLVLTGRCLPYGRGLTYWPIAELVRAAAGIVHDDPVEVVSAKLGELLEALDVDDLDELRTIAVAIAHLTAAPTTPRGTYDARATSRGELHWGIRRLFERLSLVAPLLLVIEDLHAAEPALLDLLLAVSDSAHPSRLLVITTERTGEDRSAAITPGERRRRMDLGPLDDDASRVLLEGFIGRPATDPACVPLLASAAGNPLHLEEAALAGGGGAGRTLPEVVRARIAATTTPTQRALAAAAVIGESFWEGALTAALGDHVSLDEAIDRHLVRRSRGSTIAGEREYAFEHGLIAETALAMAAPQDRCGVHAAIAAWTRRLPDADSEYPELIAHHLSQACIAGSSHLLPEALAALERAADRAVAHEGWDEALVFLDQATALLGPDPHGRGLEIAVRAAGLRALAGGTGEELASLAARAREAGRKDLMWAVAFAHAGIAARVGSEAEAIAALSRAQDAATGDPEAAIKTRLRAASIALRLSRDPARAEREALAAGAEALALGRDDLASEGDALAGEAALAAGAPGRAVEHLARCAAVARTQGSVRREIRASASLAEARRYLGPADEAEATAKRVLRWLERDPAPTIEAQVRMTLARIALEREDAPVAERWLAGDREPSPESAGAGGLALLAAARARMGRLHAAARVADAALAIDGDPADRAAAALAAAEIAGVTGDRERARAELARGIEAADACPPLRRADLLRWAANLAAAIGDGGRAAAAAAISAATYRDAGAAAFIDPEHA